MSARLTWPQVLAWRMRRQLVEPVGKSSVPEVVRRLCGVQAQVASSAELAIRVRRQASRRGEVARALSEGRLIKTWAMRGTLHLLTPEDGGTIPAVALTGYASAVDESKAYAAGYQVHMTKPVELRELAATVAKLAGRSKDLTHTVASKSNP